MEDDSSDKSHHQNGDEFLKSEEVFVLKQEDEYEDNADYPEPTHPSNKLKCDQCEFSTRNHYNLKIHRKLHGGRTSFKDWSNALCIKLIEEYKKNEVVWNPKHPFYYSKGKKNEAWESIVSNLNVAGLGADEAQKKINSLLSSFRREKLKIKKSVAVGQEYISKWFAFEHMQFLLNRDEMKPNRASNSFQSDSDDSEDESNSVVKDSDAVESEEILDDLNASEDLLNLQPKRSLESASPPTPKRQKNSNVTSTDLFVELVQRVTDPEAIYAQYIALKLRKYSPRTRAHVEHAISNVLFEADIGKFDNT